MKVRIQSVEDLKKAASDKLKEEFSQRYQEAILEGAVQGMAFVMYVLEINQGWKEKRQQKLFADMMSIVELIDAAPWLQAYNALDIKKHIQDTYGIDFEKLLNRVGAIPPEKQIE